MYAIGDIREKLVRQITATNDGTIAATMILKDILKAKKLRNNYKPPLEVVVYIIYYFPKTKENIFL